MLKELFHSFFLSSRVYKYKFWIGRFRDDKEICRETRKAVAMLKSEMVNHEKGVKGGNVVGRRRFCVQSFRVR
jgi:hypothetical protein